MVISFIETSDDLSSFDENFYNVESSKRNVCVWAKEADEGGYDIKISRADVSVLAENPDAPPDIREFCRQHSDEVTNPFDPEIRMRLVRSKAIGTVFIPDKISDIPVLIKSFRQARKTSDDPHARTLLFSIVFSAIAAIGENFEKVVVENVNHVYLPISQLLLKFGMQMAEPCSPSTLLNTALMSLCMIGKEVNNLNYQPFQLSRFKAFSSTVDESLNDPEILSHRVLLDVSRTWSQFQNFVNKFIMELLVAVVESPSSVESAMLEQIKMVIDHAKMRSFQVAVKEKNRLMTAHWFTDKNFATDFCSGFREAYSFYLRQDERVRPYIKILKLPGYEVLNQRKYSVVNYAVGMILKVGGGENSSFNNLIVESHNLTQSQQSALRARAATERPESLDTLTAEEINIFIANWNSSVSESVPSVTEAVPIVSTDHLTAGMKNFITTGKFNLGSERAITNPTNEY